MANIFNSVKIKMQRKNKFNLSFASRLTTEFGRLTPFLFEETLPNDSFKISTAIRCQFAPMKFPVMQKFTVYLHYFFVARRLLMDDWETFITRGEDGVTKVPYPVMRISEDYWDDFTVPQLKKQFGASSLYDYIGFPHMTDDELTNIFMDDNDPAKNDDIDLMPFKAYQLIYNRWYRDQTLSPEIDIHPEITGNHVGKIPNSELAELFKLRNRAWKKDYFTSALPDPQRGPDVTLPLINGSYPLTVDGDVNVLSGGIQLAGKQPGYENPHTLQMHTSGGNRSFVSTDGSGDAYPDNSNVEITGRVDSDDLRSSVKLNIGTDGVRSATINEVRRAFALQRWYELAARAGNRYIEQILAHFGIRSSDARLQNPEYIGGAVVPVNVGDILQTSESGSTPLGTPAGIAQAMGRNKPIRWTCEEHGYIIGIMSIVPEASYPQGTPRKFLRRETFDFAWPLLANIGEQEIQRRELYTDRRINPSEQRAGFGYAPRYAEYKFGLGQVHGDFRTSLRDFHDARFFSKQPFLNDEFLQVSTANDGDDGLNRIFAVRSSDMADHLWCNLYNDIRVRRVLPKYGTPV